MLKGKAKIEQQRESSSERREIPLKKISLPTKSAKVEQQQEMNEISKGKKMVQLTIETKVEQQREGVLIEEERNPLEKEKKNKKVVFPFKKSRAVSE